MQSEAVQGGLMPLIPMMFMSLFLGIVAYFMAREKGRNVALWTILGCIPMVNFFATIFFVGAANLRVEKKLDTIITQLQKKNLQ